MGVMHTLLKEIVNMLQIYIKTLIKLCVAEENEW